MHFPSSKMIVTISTSSSWHILSSVTACASRYMSIIIGEASNGHFGRRRKMWSVQFNTNSNSSKLKYNNAHSSTTYSTNQREEAPEYNHGLSGKGKTNKKTWKKYQSRNQMVQPKEDVLFGIHPVSLALVSSHRQHLHTLYMDSKHRQAQYSQAVDSLQKLAGQRGVPVEFVPKNTLTYLSGNRPHQGVCLDASPRLVPGLDLQQMQRTELNRSALWLLLYNIQDPMNFGAILRTSHFLGVDRVIVPSSNSCAVSPVVSKASAGAVEVIDLYQIDGTFRSLRCLAQLWQSLGGQIIGTASGSDSQRDIDTLQDYAATSPVLLVVGNEGRGVDEDVLDLCDTLLTIPSPSATPDQISSSAVESLNVSVATGILIHWLRTMKKIT